MDSKLIAQHWDGIGHQHSELVSTFYIRLFERYPQYRHLFPDTHSHQMSGMVDTLALIAKGAHLPDLFSSHVQRIRERHAEFDLDSGDYRRFISVLLEVLGEYNTQDWSPECETAWGEALEQFILPGITGHRVVG